MDITETLNKERVLTRHKIAAIAIFIACFLVLSGAVLIKYLVFDKIELRPLSFLSVMLCFALTFFSYLVYMLNSRKNLVAIPKALAAEVVAITICNVICIYLSTLNFYLMPIILSSFLIAPISKRRDAFIGNLFSVILLFIALFSQSLFKKTFSVQALCMLANGIAFGTIASYTIATNAKRLTYVAKGFVIGLFSLGFSMLFAYILNYNSSEFLLNLAFGAVSVVAQVVLGLLLQPLFEAIFNLVTNSRLVEFTDHRSPLIKRLIAEAPGTFNHSLAVANFAEMCATAIGENPYLARACAYYHDIGKLVNPQFFKENQAGFNPHDELLPEVSAEVIRSHTTEGLKLCKKFRVPSEISHVTTQHHGTLPISVFFYKAKKLTDSEVDMYDYRYHGTTPTTKIAAIIMLCDTGEAAIRAMDDPDGERIDKMLRGVIDERLKLGQFDNCDISIHEIDIIRQTIINAFGGLFHKRLKYPGGEK